MAIDLHPEWFDLSLSVLIQQGLVEETDEGGLIPKFKLTTEGKLQAKQAAEVMYNAGYLITDTQQQVHMRRSARGTKERRFLRPDHSAASAWIDNPTTAKEENPVIPKTVGGNMWWYARPVMPMDLVGEIVRAVHPKYHQMESFNERMNAEARQSPEAVAGRIADAESIEEDERISTKSKNEALSQQPIHRCDSSKGVGNSYVNLPRAVIRRNRRGAAPIVNFEPLPITLGNHAKMERKTDIPNHTEDDDDATTEMSVTMSENNQDIAKKNKEYDIQPWEMRK